MLPKMPAKAPSNGSSKGGSKWSSKESSKESSQGSSKGSSKHSTYRRNPFGYDGPNLTTRKLQEILPQVFGTLQERYQAQPKLLLERWPQIIGETLAPLTRAERFENGVLYVTVKHATLLSLLYSTADKQKILEAIKKALPGIVCRNIVFRMGKI